MAQRVIHIGADVDRLTTEHRRLSATYQDGSQRSTPCEDLAAVIIDHVPGLNISARLLSVLAEHGVTVILSNDRHLPEATLLPLAGISSVPAVLHAQIKQSRPRKKRAWQQLVQAKIRLQAANLDHAPAAQRRLLHLADTTKSGDPDNHEAQAARLYWRNLPEPVNRKPRSDDGLNSALDYGYTVTRAVLARAVSGVGLNPALGFFHRSKSNPLQLVDDLIEPLRPQLDAHLLRSPEHLGSPLTPQHKRYILTFLHEPFSVDSDTATELPAACTRYALCVRSYIHGLINQLDTPIRQLGP